MTPEIKAPCRVRPPIDRFMEKIKKLENGCWEWTASKYQSGYGSFKMDGRVIPSHRFSYQYFRGSIPPNLVIDHLCRNRACVNPDHLEVVDNKTNILRGVGMGARWARRTHCSRGHKLPPYDGKSREHCWECNALSKREYYLNNIEKISLYDKSRRDRFVSLGLCPRCGGKRESENKICRKCLDSMN